MEIGDTVVRRSYDKDVTFKVIDIKNEDGEEIYVLKGINIRIIADSRDEDLIKVEDASVGEKDKILNARVSTAIKRAVILREDNIALDEVDTRSKNQKKKSERDLIFGRPGKILHIDGDNEYLETCLKVYKQLELEAIGVQIPEDKQPDLIVDLVKQYKPDIVVLTGHDAINKGAKDLLNIDNYKNSKYYIESVRRLRNYNSSYDELVIFAGACQSCYESLLEAGANFASSPSRVLIHCLDPVFVCEKIAYTKIDKITSLSEIIDGTITGVKGVGGLQTRGKYREGYPKSSYI